RIGHDVPRVLDEWALEHRAALLVFRLGSRAAQELVLIDGPDAELARAIEFAAGVAPHDHEAGALGHRRRHVSAGIFHQLRCRFARERGQRTRDDDRLAHEATGAVPPRPVLPNWLDEVHALRAELCDET